MNYYIWLLDEKTKVSTLVLKTIDGQEFKSYCDTLLVEGTMFAARCDDK